LADPDSLQHRIAGGINNIIALVDSDPAFHFRGNEAGLVPYADTDTTRSVAAVHSFYKNQHTIVLVNVGQKAKSITANLSKYDLDSVAALFDNISGEPVPMGAGGKLSLTVQPYQSMWLTTNRIEIPHELLHAADSG